MPNKEHGHGLKPSSKNPFKRAKNYSYHKTFGAAPLPALPEEYMLVSAILNQGNTEHCTAYAACAVRASELGAEFDPEEFFRQEGVTNGSVSESGYQLSTALTTAKNIGFKQLSDNSTGYKIPSYFEIDGPYDRTDNLRSAMWLNKAEKNAGYGGTSWFSEWTYAPGGLIPTTYSVFTGLHAVKVAGWKTINGVLRIGIQNSYGSSLGDNGINWFTRETFNKEFNEGLFMFSTVTDQQIQTLGSIVTILTQIADAFRRLIQSFQKKSQ